jgi:hypothetical protein
MTDLQRLALQEITRQARLTQSRFMTLCTACHVDLSTTGSQEHDIYTSLCAMERWAEAIQKEPQL